jgi:hypothetical protein
MPLTELPAGRSQASIAEGVELEKEVVEEVLDELKPTRRSIGGTAAT